MADRPFRYRMYRKMPRTKFPAVISIFSAPNYQDVYGNRGAILKYVNSDITIRQYLASPHPCRFPDFQNALTWSAPFVGAKSAHRCLHRSFVLTHGTVKEMLVAIMSIRLQKGLQRDHVDDDDEQLYTARMFGLLTAEEVERRRGEIKGKIMAVGCMLLILKRLRCASFSCLVCKCSS
jgi:serine/threonine-protein phosphatase 2B catalytic subunit